MTEKQKKIVEFVAAAKGKRRYLCEFEYILPISHNKRYEWMIRGAVLAKMVKAGILKVHIAENRNKQYYYI